MKITCILIDDEPFALDILEDDLLAFENIEVVEKFVSPSEALDFLAEHPVDLIFTDIQMPEQLGTQLVRSIENPPLIIFTTAYHQFAVEGFELNAVDYLMKPIRKERLAVAIEKVENQLKLREKSAETEEENFIVVYAEYKKVKLFYDEIIYIEGLKDYVKIYLENRVHPLLTRSNLKGIGQRLSDKKFMRIHNSYIVNKSKITGFHQTIVALGAVELPVGKHFVENVNSLIAPL